MIDAVRERFEDFEASPHPPLPPLQKETELLQRQMIRAGASNENATLRERLHRHCINTLITLNTLFLLPAVLHKSRGIEDNGIKSFSYIPQIRFHIVTDKLALAASKPLSLTFSRARPMAASGAIRCSSPSSPHPRGHTRKTPPV